MTSPFTFSIRTGREDVPADPGDCDSAIMTVPDGWYGTIGGQRAVLAQLVGRHLRLLSEAMAADLGRELHHADWVFTTDPELVEEKGMMHGCPECRASTDQALASLKAHPDKELAVGVLWWSPEN